MAWPRDAQSRGCSGKGGVDSSSSLLEHRQFRLSKDTTGNFTQHSWQTEGEGGTDCRGLSVGEGEFIGKGAFGWLEAKGGTAGRVERQEPSLPGPAVQGYHPSVAQTREEVRKVTTEEGRLLS